MSAKYDHLDSDEYRLPAGMTRTGYDADTQTYFYRDADGTAWEGEEGNHYGRLHRAGGTTTARPGMFARAHDDTPVPPPRYQDLDSRFEQTSAHDAPDIVSRRQQYEDWRYLFPFFLIVGVVLLLLFRFLVSAAQPAARACEDGTQLYSVRKGDTCWSIGEKSGSGLDALKGANPGLDCDALMPGTQLCV